jgi:CheY-like chemotaxis protein/anti-sigma regulatory factor (Ser/Thr protein kinase)
MNSHEKQNLFMASISHELRTPLTSILGYGELLEDTNLDSKQKEYLNRMLHSSKYLLSLVGDFLDIVKLEKNDIKLEEKEVRLHTILMECADVIKTNLHPNVFFDVKIPFLDYTIIADERRIKQVILNILSNAAKFTQEGSIKFHVKDITDTQEDVTITVNIEDTGIGMSPEIQKVLFDPFATSDSTQGFGLGLFISKEIIKLMHGEISTISEEGEGSTFVVSFKVKKGQKKISKQILSNKSILIFSQESSLINDVSKLLENFNATLHHYIPDQNIANISEYLSTKKRKYDIVIFDISIISDKIPEIISKIKLIQPDIKCIGLITQKIDLSISNFDKLIEFPSSPKDIIFELEEFLANNYTLHTKFMDFSRLRVLIVEDVEMSYEYIKEMLSISFSIHCDHVSNGKEAVKKVKNNTYDIVFMDIRMPVMNGYEATKKIREFNKNIPIICMSADVYAKDRVAAKAAGMNRFITKPLDKNEVKQVFLDLNAGEITKNISSIPLSREEEKNIYKTVTYDPLKLKEKVYSHLGKTFDDKIVIATLLEKAVESIEKYINSIKRNKIEQNTEALIEDMHAMKGVLANLGLKDPSSVAGEIQKIFQAGDLQKAYKIKNDFLQSISYFVNELKKDIK